MSNALKHQRGFSLPETVLAMALMVLTVTALAISAEWRKELSS